jgi:hypothetical protein
MMLSYLRQQANICSLKGNAHCSSELPKKLSHKGCCGPLSPPTPHWLVIFELEYFAYSGDPFGLELASVPHKVFSGF